MLSVLAVNLTVRSVSFPLPDGLSGCVITKQTSWACAKLFENRDRKSRATSKDNFHGITFFIFLTTSFQVIFFLGYSSGLDTKCH